MNPNVIWTIAIAIFWFVMGAFLPTVAIIVARYVQHWRGQADRSVIRLILGIILRIYGPYLPIGFVVLLAEAINPDIINSDIANPDVSPTMMIALNLGFWGSIALFLFAYLRGRKERLRTPSK